MQNGIVIPQGYCTRAMVAERVGKSLSVIKRMEKCGDIRPYKTKRYGKLVVGLYRERDLQHIRDVAALRHPGRPRKEDKKQLQYI